VEKYDYNVYGSATIRDTHDSIRNTSSVGNPYFFTGRRLDTETRLYYYRARYYSPTLGRFLQADPIGYQGGINLYSYCGNKPLIFLDPYGLDWFDAWSNFWAGAGDSLSFGLTGLVRKAIAVDDVVDYHSTSYTVGEYTEVAVEIGVTAGSAAMKTAARKAAQKAAQEAAERTGREMAESIGRRIVRQRGKKYLPDVAKGIRHHKYPLFGHPGRAKTLFPTGGLPPQVHSGAWNITVAADRVAHTAMHTRLMSLEKGLAIGFNPYMTGARGFRNYLIDSSYLTCTEPVK